MNRRSFLGIAAATVPIAAIIADQGLQWPQQRTGYDDWVQLPDVDMWMHKRTKQRVASIVIHQAGARHPAEL